MKLLESSIKCLLKLIDAGLTNGGGDMREPGHFCVQQAVSRAILKDTEYNDQPNLCVAESVLSFGIYLNDCDWSCNKARAKGMRDFAVAQLGSNEIQYLNEINTQDFWNLVNKNYPDLMPEDDAELSRVANAAVEVLKELGSPGCKYLGLTKKQAKKQAKKDIKEMKKSYAASFYEKGTCGTHCFIEQ